MGMGHLAEGGGARWRGVGVGCMNGEAWELDEGKTMKKLLFAFCDGNGVDAMMDTCDEGKERKR